jgi:hypothetical protein
MPKNIDHNEPKIMALKGHIPTRNKVAVNNTILEQVNFYKFLEF